MTRPPHESGRRDLSGFPHVVVIGGGFAGVACARGLVNKDVRVTIVDKHNFHTFLPLLYQVATAGLEPADVAYPIRTIFGHADNIGFRHGRVRAVDQDANHLIMEDDSVIAYDYLVVATGATAAFFDIPGASRYAMPLYSLADARRLRNRLLLSLESADVGADLVGQLESWHEASALRALARVGVVPRPGSATVAPPGWDVYEIEMDPVDLSSTFLRETPLDLAHLKMFMPDEVIAIYQSVAQ